MNYGELLFSLLVSLQAVFKKKINIKDVSFPQILAISIIEPQGIDMSTISERMGIDNSTATRLIIGLEKKGWVKRIRSEVDSRVVNVFFTQKGEAFQKEIEDQIDKLGSLFERGLDSNQKTELNDQLSSIHWLISKLELEN
tara:strand:- start:152 stop:574 length:423 start_codon:yes stop_codon:yes gene_type:complete